MSNSKFSFLKKHSISDQADHIADYLPDDETFEGKIVANTNIRKILEVLGVQANRFEELLNIFTIEMDPSCAVHILEEWEKMLGIPDDCFSVDGETLVNRQRNALIKLARMSVQTNEDFTTLANSFGVTATVQSGIDSGITFSGGDQEARFTVVISFVGEETEVFPYTFPIAFGSVLLGILECVFQKIKPANCNVRFIESDPPPSSVDGDIVFAMDVREASVPDENEALRLIQRAGSALGFGWFGTSLRSDGTGFSISYEEDAHHIAGSGDINFLFDYRDGFTVEIIVKIDALQTTVSFGSIGAGVNAMDSPRNLWVLRFDDFDGGSVNPCFTLSRNTYEGDFQYGNISVELRGSTPIVLGDTYHLMGTIRPSDDTIEFWVNGTSIGTASIPTAWYGTIGGDSVLDPTENFRPNNVISVGASDQTGGFGGDGDGSVSVDNLMIHFLEADQAFATAQASAADFTTPYS